MNRYPLFARWIIGAPDWGEASPELIALAESYRVRLYADSTMDRCEGGLRDWFAFCERVGTSPVPASELAVSAHCSALAQRGNGIGAIRNRVATINLLHLTNGYPRPGRGKLREVLKGISRTTSCRRKLPLTREPVMQMVRLARRQRRPLIALRDAAILLTFHTAALRLSELAQLQANDVAFNAVGATIYLPRSKGDQWGAGQEVTIEATGDPSGCPVLALRAWLKASQIHGGVLFRPVLYRGLGANAPGELPDRALSDTALNTLVKDYAARIGLDPADYSVRSLRSGFATSAWQEGRSLMGIKRTMRHRQFTTTATYITEASPFERNATRVLGL